jgi:tetratricopeptide (TPR) repeat protein
MKKAILFTLIIVLITGYAAGQENEPADTKMILQEQVAPSSNKEAMEAYNIGTRLLGENELSKAESYLKKAIALDPLFVDAMDHLGIVYRRQKKYRQAEAIYLKSLEINANNPVPYINLALVYRDQNRLNDAFESYKKLIAIKPNDPEPYYGMGELYRMSEDYENAILSFATAVEKYKLINSEYIYDAYYYLGIIYYEMERYDDALRYLNMVKEKYPKNTQLLNLIKEIDTIR